MSTAFQVIAASGGQTLFYVAGAALAAWAVVLSALGLSRPRFPGGLGGSRAVMGFTGVLVVATMVAAVATATKPGQEEAGKEGVSEGPGRQRELREGQAGGTPGGRPARPGETGQAAGTTLAVSADPGGQLRYQQRSLTAGAGRVTIQFTNSSPVTHDVRIERGGRTIGGTRTIASSKTSASVQLQPGSYTFYCSVDGHRQAGMHGPLSVR